MMSRYCPRKIQHSRIYKRNRATLTQDINFMSPPTPGKKVSSCTSEWCRGKRKEEKRKSRRIWIFGFKYKFKKSV